MARLMNLNTGEIVNLQSLHMVGLQQELSHIVLTHANASVNHATITWDGEYWQLQDTSNNGTFINGVRIMRGSQFRLNKGEKVSFGGPAEDAWQLLDEKPPKFWRGPVKSIRSSLTGEYIGLIQNEEPTPLRNLFVG